MVDTTGLSLVNYLYNSSSSSSVWDYFASRIAQNGGGTTSSTTSGSTSSTTSSYKKVDLSTIDTLKTTKAKLSVVAQALSNISTQMNAISETGLYSRGAAMAGQAEDIADALTVITDKMDAKTASKAEKTAVENVLKALNLIQQTISTMQNKVPSSKAITLREAVQSTVDTIKTIAEKFDFSIKTSKTATTETVVDSTKLLDITA